MSNSVNAQCSAHSGRRRGFYSSLQMEERQELERSMSSSSCPAGTALFEEGTPANKVFILLEGQVKLSVNLSDGKRFILRMAQAGELLGLESVLTGDPYEMMAEAFYSCRIASAGREDFLGFLQSHPSAMRSAACSLGRYYGDACARFRTIGGTAPITAKLARLLLELSSSGELTDRGTRLRLTLTHEEIGECVGMSRESVSRVLCDFQRRNLITKRGSILMIKDRSSLERCAAICYGMEVKLAAADP
jgi:CRP/FNR family transcriptional regulator, cyclic AMP receptor protein